MKKNFLVIATVFFAGALTMTSCTKEEEKEEETTVVVDDSTVEVTSNITEDTEWTKDKVYILTTRVAVESGATLTIQAGTVIKGRAGSATNATALLVAKGAKIMANGTADEPIIMTSEADPITSGTIASPTLPADLDGLWGGLIVLGNAPVSADAASVQIEGIPDSDPNGLYGGSDSLDNSGVITYVSVRHGGANIGAGNEINGITLGGVGAGTVIENIEVVANQDDGVEFFGGSVSAKNVLVWNNGDDALDTDQAWSGTVDNFVVINPGDEALELDGGEGTFNREQTFVNGTVYAFDAQGLADLDDKDAIGSTWVDFSNVYFTAVEEGQDFDDNTSYVTLDALQATLPDGAAVADYFKEGSDAYVTEVADGANTVGADLTKFVGWTWAAVAGEI